MHDCRAQVDAIVAARKSQLHPEGVPGREVAQRLAQLPHECRATLRSKARDLLAGLPRTSEGDFAAVLEALVALDDPEVPDLAMAAIRNPHALVKEDYISILDDLDRDDQALSALLAVLDDGMQNPGRPDLTNSIRALHAAQSIEALDSIARYVGHPDVSVRGSAATFLYQFDESGRVGPTAFAAQLRRETQPDMLELLIDGLRGWGARPDESILRRLAVDQSLPEELRSSAQKALAEDGSG